MTPFTVNGQSRRVEVAEDTPLLWVLRDTLGMVGTKFGCRSGPKHCAVKRSRP